MAATSNEVSGRPSTRIPAWKRLGLKLKYAKETTDQPAPTRNDPSVPSSHKETKIEAEKSSNDLAEDVRPAKKRKTSSESIHPEDAFTTSTKLASPSISNLEPTSVGHGNEGTITAENEGNPSSLLPKSSPAPLQRRKSVTFTEDTKREDGISAKTLFNQPITTDPFTAVTESTENHIQPRKTKKQRKSGKIPSEEASDSGPPQYLQYLERFEGDRSDWKFNKNHQNNLLKHIFDVQLIPEKYNNAILQYLDGLKGAALRTRLIESATATLHSLAEKEGSGEEIAAMESAEAKRNAYGAAMKRQINRMERIGESEYDDLKLDEMRREVAAAKRAEDTLRLLLEQELRDGPPKSSTPSTPISGQAASVITINSGTSGTSSQPQRKKRKTRTNTTASDDSDSDTSDSERDESSQGPTTIRQALRGTPSSARSYDIPKKPAVPLEKLARGKKIIFDEELLDAMFPQSKAVVEATAAKRKQEEIRKHESETSSDSSSSADSDSE